MRYNENRAMRIEYGHVNKNPTKLGISLKQPYFNSNDISNENNSKDWRIEFVTGISSNHRAFQSIRVQITSSYHSFLENVRICLDSS